MIFLKEERSKRVLQEMDKNNLSQMIITETAPIFYLTGVWIHSGERLMALYINTKGDKKFIVNELFPVDNNLGVEVVYYNDTENPLDLLKGIINNNEVLGVDKDFKAHFLIGLMDRKVAKSFVNSSPIIDKIRMIKDLEEINLMREASRINDLVVEKVITEIKDGISEEDKLNIQEYVYNKLSKILWVNECKSLPAVVIGGSIKTIGRIHQMEYDVYCNIHGLELYKKDIESLLQKISKLSLEEIISTTGLSKTRGDILLGALITLNSIITYLNCSKIIISKYTIREGIINDYMKVHDNSYDQN